MAVRRYQSFPNASSEETGVTISSINAAIKAERRWFAPMLMWGINIGVRLGLLSVRQGAEMYVKYAMRMAVDK